MGYSPNECLLCKGNNPVDDQPSSSICTDCFKAKSEPLYDRLGHFWKIFNQHCDFCGKSNKLVLYKATFCAGHMPSNPGSKSSNPESAIPDNPNTPDNSDNTDNSDNENPGSDLCMAGKCKCIKCDHFHSKLNEKFDRNIRSIGSAKTIQKNKFDKLAVSNVILQKRIDELIILNEKILSAHKKLKSSIKKLLDSEMIFELD